MSGVVIFSAKPSSVMSQALRSAASGDGEYERTSKAWRVSGFKSSRCAQVVGAASAIVARTGKFALASRAGRNRPVPPQTPIDSSPRRASIGDTNDGLADDLPTPVQWQSPFRLALPGPSSAISRQASSWKDVPLLETRPSSSRDRESRGPSGCVHRRGADEETGRVWNSQRGSRVDFPAARTGRCAVERVHGAGVRGPLPGHVVHEHELAEMEVRRRRAKYSLALRRRSFCQATSPNSSCSGQPRTTPRTSHPMFERPVNSGESLASTPLAVKRGPQLATGVSSSTQTWAPYDVGNMLIVMDTVKQ